MSVLLHTRQPGRQIAVYHDSEPQPLQTAAFDCLCLGLLLKFMVPHCHGIHKAGWSDYFNHYFNLLDFRSITLQNTTATAVLTAVAAIPGPTMAVGFTLPYCAR